MLKLPSSPARTAPESQDSEVEGLAEETREAETIDPEEITVTDLPEEIGSPERTGLTEVRGNPGEIMKTGLPGETEKTEETGDQEETTKTDLLEETEKTGPQEEIEKIEGPGETEKKAPPEETMTTGHQEETEMKVPPGEIEMRALPEGIEKIVAPGETMTTKAQGKTGSPETMIATTTVEITQGPREETEASNKGLKEGSRRREETGGRW